MKVLQAITKTLRCLWCVSNPEASRVQLSGPSEPPEASNTHPVLEEPAPADTPADAPVDSPNSDATDQSSHLESPPGGWQDFKKTAKGALWTILKIAKEASGTLPPLRAAIGGAVAVMEVSDVSMRGPRGEIYSLTTFYHRNIAQTETQSASSTNAFAPCYKSSTASQTRKIAPGKFHSS